MTCDHDSETPRPEAFERIFAAHEAGPEPTTERAGARPWRPAHTAPPKTTEARWSHDWALPPVTPGVWKDVSPKDADEALGIYAEDVANEHIPNFLFGAEIERMRATPLGFYPGQLLFECQLTLKNGPRVLFCFPARSGRGRPA